MLPLDVVLAVLRNQSRALDSLRCEVHDLMVAAKQKHQLRTRHRLSAMCLGALICRHGHAVQIWHRRELVGRHDVNTSGKGSAGISERFYPARIGWPSLELSCEWLPGLKPEHPLLKNVFGFVDGKNYRVRAYVVMFNLFFYDLFFSLSIR
ncbi:hypothetical protein GQ600_27390 [Phytophthora cactorum]|nr:hypothetical protein GQ600_27390 [Phytophthora cactorum]